MQSIVIKYVVDTNDLSKAEANSKKAQQATDDLRKSVKSVSVEVEDTGKKAVKSFSDFQKTVATFLAAGLLTKFITEMVKLSAESQKAGAVLTNALGSKSAAQQALRDLTAFAAKTPFQITQLTSAFVKLVNQGFKPTISQLENMGDLAASTGKELDQLAEALIDAQTGEFERLKEFGIKAKTEGDKIRFTFKGVETQVTNNAEAIRDYIVSLGDLQGVSGSMAAIAETTGGKLSNLRDNLDQILTTLGNRSSGVINAFLDLANEALGAVNDGLNDQVEALKNEQTALNVLVGAITDANIEEEVRGKLIEQLNRTYPDFLKNLDAEKISNEQLQARLKDVNDQFFRRIALQSAEEKFKKQSEDFLDLIDEEIEARIRLNKVRAGEISFRGTTPKGGAEGLTPDQQRDQEEFRLNEKITNIQRQRTEIQRTLNERLAEYNAALGVYNNSAANYFDNETNANKATKAHTDDLKKKKNELSAISEQLAYQSDLELFQTKKILEERREQRKKADESEAENDKRSFELWQYFADLKLQKQQEYSEEAIKIEEDEAARVARIKREREEAAFTALSLVTEFYFSSENAEAASLQRRINATRAFYDEQITLAGNNEESKKRIRAREDQDLARLERQRADREKRSIQGGIIANTALAIIKIFAGEGTYIDKLIRAGIMAGQGAVQYANASRVRYYAKGALNIQGPGTATSDSIPAMLSRGESVMTADQTRQSFGILTDIRTGKLNDKLLSKLVNDRDRIDSGKIVDVLERIYAKKTPAGTTLLKDGATVFEVIQSEQGNIKKQKARIMGR